MTVKNTLREFCLLWWEVKCVLRMSESKSPTYPQVLNKPRVDLRPGSAMAFLTTNSTAESPKAKPNSVNTDFW